MSEPPAKRARAQWPKRWAKMTPFSLYWAARERLFDSSLADWHPDEAMELARRAGDRGNEAGRYLYHVLAAGRLPQYVDELFVTFDHDANEGNEWGMFFSGLLCERHHDHTIDSTEVEGVCPLLLKAAKAGNVDAMAEVGTVLKDTKGTVSKWLKLGVDRKHPLALYSFAEVTGQWHHMHTAGELGYYYSFFVLASGQAPLTRLRYYDRAITQSVRPSRFVFEAKQLIQQVYVEKFAKGDQSASVLRDLATIGSLIKPWLEELFPGKVFANLVVRLYDKWCFRSRRTTLYWMWMWKEHVFGDTFPRDVALIIAKLIWESRFDPICGWERHDIW